MPEKIIEEIVNDGGQDDTKVFEKPVEEVETPIQANRFGTLIEKLRTPAVDKPIEVYNNHPLNRSKSEHVSYLLRGLEAFSLTFDLAIFDIATGAWGLYTEMKRPVMKTEVTETVVHGV